MTEEKQAKVSPPLVETSRWFPDFEASIPKQEGKVVVITGTTSGTGNVAAKTSLSKGAKVIMLNRNEEKARKSMAEFFKDHPDKEEMAHFVKCDLQDFESVKEAAENVKEIAKNTGIDVLANNAGIAGNKKAATKDGFEVQMQTNHLSHFLLTKELYPLLEKAASDKGEARVVNMGSTVRLFAGFLKARHFQKDMSRLGNDGNNMMFGGRWTRYGQSKLANSVFTVELQKRLARAHSKIAVYCAHPGLSSTGMPATLANDGALKSTDFLKGAQSPEDGTMGLLKCMFLDNLKKGALYGPNGNRGMPTRRYHGMNTTSRAGAMLWRESEKACGKFEIA